MRIEVNRIPQGEKVKLSEDVSAGEWDLDSFDIKFVDDIHIDCNFERFGKVILVDADVRIHRLITCSRCLEEIGQVNIYSFQLNYNLSECSQYLDVDKGIREELLLNFPMKVLCSPECRGLCPVCGANLNKGECGCQKEAKGDS